MANASHKHRRLNPPAVVRRSRTVTFEVHGPPQPKGSTRSLRNRDGSIRTFSDNPKLRTWEDAVAWTAKTQAGGVLFAEGPVTLIVEFWLNKAPTVRRAHATAKPDLSKLIRGLEDALSHVLWTDDAQVTSIMASKQYESGQASPRAIVTVTGFVQVDPAAVAADV